MHYTTTHESGTNYFMTVMAFHLGESANSALAVMSLTPAFNVHITILKLMHQAFTFELDSSLEFVISLTINHLKLDPSYDA